MGLHHHRRNTSPQNRPPAPEALLRDLLACWPNDPNGFAGTSARVRDWPELVRLAERHGVLGVLDAPLSANPALRPLLESRRQVARIWADHLLDGLDAVLAAFAAAGVSVLVLKGPVLSERLYGDATLRRSTDLDLLVSPAELDRAVAVLAALGYQTEAGASARYHREHHHHLCLAHPRRPAVELHFRVYVGYGAALTADEFLKRSLPYRTGRGHDCRVLAPADEALYLCLHAAGHDFERLAWLYDLKVLLARYPDLDWSAVFARAEAAGVAGAVAFTLETLRRRLGAHSPAADVFVGRHGRRRHAAGQLLAAVEALPRPSLPAKLVSLALQALLCDRPTRGVWLLRHHLGRVARRRLHRLWPTLLPEHWSA